MTKGNQDTAPTKGALRVQHFRKRMTNDYRRVEAYITADEKSQLDQIKTELNINNDIAVAGLIRMGLEQYAQAQAAVATPLDDTFGGQLRSLSASASLQSTNSVGLSGNVGSVFAQHPPMSFGASSVSNSSPVTAHPLNNPIARFFRSRKENNND